MDYGNAVSQKGYDVKTCADRLLVYSSAFQTLKIFNVYSVSTTIPASGVNTITITHNLGYYAPYFVVYNGSSNIGTSKSYYGGVDSQNTSVTTERMYTNSLDIDVPDSFEGSDTGATVYFTVYIFLDDFSTITEQNINTDVGSGASSNDYGFRISKAGFDVKTCANKDCIITSSTPTHIVHKKGTATASPVSHNLGYIPAVIGYLLTSGNSYIEKITMGANTTDISFSISAGDTAYYIIFKNRNE